MHKQVLVVDKGGQPRGWTGLQEEACKYYAEGMVICDLGSPIYTFYGGKNKDGEQSKITISSIIMVTGPVLSKDFYNRETLYCERDILLRRDAGICAYCGIQFHEHELTIDHVIPRSQGGGHFWTNVVAACSSCNHAKGPRTPEQAGMPLLYVPFAPSKSEKLLLEKRHVLADQMEFLLSKINKNSRVRNNPLYQLN